MPYLLNASKWPKHRLPVQICKVARSQTVELGDGIDHIGTILKLQTFNQVREQQANLFRFGNRPAITVF